MNDAWTIEDAAELYNITGWGRGIFQINERGHLVMSPASAPKGKGIDLKLLADDMRRRGVDLPLLVRFTDIIRHRIDGMVDAFRSAFKDYGYEGRYRPVFPIKVNPQSHVLRDVMNHGRPHNVGLEAGSKPELMVVLALMEDKDALIVCNGYKDKPYIRMALLARRLGFECVIVLEKPDELETVLAVSRELDIPPVIGVRARLSDGGVGRWDTSTGDSAKFGLSIPEIVDVVERLRKEDQLDCLRLLHFHIGSQISQIKVFRGAIREGARMYVELKAMGAPMGYLDIGGGVGIDYDGNNSTDASSINYNVGEYASAVVGTIFDVCNESNTPHPHIITESGRSMVAHHSVLLLEALGKTTKEQGPPERPEGEPHRLIAQVWETFDAIHSDNLVETLHDVQAIRREAKSRFSLGLLSLPERAYIERMYWATCTALLSATDPDDAPAEIEELRDTLIDTYFCNFSVFQSTPDVWAIDQLFPICPIHRLDEEPTRRAMLADLTCDSDGKIHRFIGDRKEEKRFLELHPVKRGERYLIGIFLVGAYQEILGDLHNLFGDTHAIHVAVADNKRGYTVLHLDEGDIIEEVMTYVHHRPKELVRMLRAKVEDACEVGTMSIEDGASLVKTFVHGLDDYTYLSR